MNPHLNKKKKKKNIYQRAQLNILANKHKREREREREREKQYQIKQYIIPVFECVSMCVCVRMSLHTINLDNKIKKKDENYKYE